MGQTMSICTAIYNYTRQRSRSRLPRARMNWLCLSFKMSLVIVDQFMPITVAEFGGALSQFVELSQAGTAGQQPQTSRGRRGDRPTGYNTSVCESGGLERPNS
jgi:hypothetical protein